MQGLKRFRTLSTHIAADRRAYDGGVVSQVRREDFRRDRGHSTLEVYISRRSRAGWCLLDTLRAHVRITHTLRLLRCSLFCRESTTDAQREGYEDEIISMVRASLVDDETEVRSAAAKAFDILRKQV